MQGARWQGRCSRLAERIPGQRLPAEGSPASSPRLRSRGRQLRCQEWRRSRFGGGVPETASLSAQRFSLWERSV